MAHAHAFLQDLAVIMMLAGVTTLIFNRLKQPVVLGYIAAGMIAGPYTPPYSLVSDRSTIEMLAELGVIFLLFSLGLEFSLRKLKKVGATAFIAALTEIVLMLWVGYEIGRAFGWGEMDSLFLGAMLAISSTTIIIKALDELGLKRERFAQLIFGVLIVEDILAIAILALLSGIAMTGDVSAGAVMGTVSKLGIFLVVALLLGLLLVPRLLAFVSKSNSREMLLITVLGICFGFCLLVTKMGYSMALGAFVIGAIMAEAKEIHLIERIIEPLRDMFSAIFFVAIGMLVDPGVMIEYAVPIAVITFVVIAGKILSCSIGTFAAGNDARTSLRVGMGLSQIGEFSFIIASLGLALGVISDFLYPVAVAVSAITTLTTPYLIRSADGTADLIKKVVPDSWSRNLHLYSEWLGNIRPSGDNAIIAAMIKRILSHVLLNFCVVAAVFLAGAYLVRYTEISLWMDDLKPEWRASIFWAACLMLALPFLVAAYRKLEALGLILAEMSVKTESAGQYTARVRRVIASTLPVISLIGMLLLVSALSASILPPFHLLVIVVTLAILLALALWGYFVRWHSRLQIALKETLEKSEDSSH
ncbi:MAG: cation:proton antiporter [Pedobacter sp.]|nr:cation:proton antiporter [Pedobacter sp.]